MIDSCLAFPAKKIKNILLRCILLSFALFIGITLLQVALVRFINPPCTPLMIYRLLKGEGMKYQWSRLHQISPLLQKAVMASEDQKFLNHPGFDFEQIEQALEDAEQGGGYRGASTITMQAARNLFLWQGHSWVRKALEAYYTLLLELLLGKARIMELYLNIIEWGKGVFGAEAAAQQYFHCSASEINRSQAALMAAVLPNPRRWSPASPAPHIIKRKNFIFQYMDTFTPLTNKAALSRGKK